MKRLTLLVIVLSMAVLGAACGGAPAAQPAPSVAPSAETLAPQVAEMPAPQAAETSTPTAEAAAPPAAQGSAELTDDYPDALSLRNQLALGILELEGTADAVTPGQAAQLLPLWQALSALDASSTAAPEEIAAVQNQIVAAMAPAQVAAIAQLQLTNAVLQAYYVEIGVSEVKTPEPGVTPQSGSLKDLPPEEREAARATAQALGTPVGSGSSGSGEKKDALLDNVIQLLTDRAGQ
ncbi:MAG TPA: hypothetical protein VL334_15510 [Anaerolineae bacterium]|nr:hypothetical protein [Anaerolineae bacterium]